MPALRLTSLQMHIKEWENCDRCFLCKDRLKVVIGRGTLPCDVLLVGEAPGESENVIGQPFVGPAGKLLDRIVNKALSPIALCSVCGLVRQPQHGDWVCSKGHGRRTAGGRNVTVAYTNLVACIPRGDDTRKAEEPPEESIEACKPRLEEFIRLANPKLIVRVGLLAESWLTSGYCWSVKIPSNVDLTAVTHPAAILRQNVAQQDLSIQRCMVTLRNAVLDSLS